MGLIENLIDSAAEVLRFKDSIFIKENSDLQEKLQVLNKLNMEYPNNKNIQKELYMVKMGLYGEDEVAYQLRKSNIGMYVLRDVKFKHKSDNAQIDYVIITPYFIYYVECKNYSGNLIVNEKGDFILELSSKERIGISSPLRQVEAQREIVRKIWESNTSQVKKLIAGKNFNYYRRVLVVNSNKNSIVDTKHAPKDIKYNILRCDNLIKQLQYDIMNRKKDDLASTQKEMEQIALSYLELSSKDNIDYYDYYKHKFCNKLISDEELKNRLLTFRKERSKKMNIPAYYVFTNEELDQLVKLKPQDISELQNLLSEIKIKTHGKEIIAEINNN